MPLDPMIARGLQGIDYSNSLAQVAALRQRDRALDANDQRIAFDQQQATAEGQAQAQESAMRERLAEMEVYSSASPEIKAQYIALQRQKYPEFANTPFAQMPPDQAFEGMRRGLMARLGMQAEQSKPPQMRSIYDGTMEVQQEFDQQTGQWREVGRGNRWQPQQAPQYAPESFSSELDDQGNLILVGNRGTIRDTGRKGQKPADSAQVKADEKRASAEQSWTMYEAAMSGLSGAMKEVESGPIVGRLPAFSAAAQTADGAVAAMAPILKQLFRTAGEGTFTDKDQQLLLEMVPTRADREEARQAKIANINKIVRAKLGLPPLEASDGLTPEEKAELEELRKRFKGR